MPAQKSISLTNVEKQTSKSAKTVCLSKVWYRIEDIIIMSSWRPNTKEKIQVIYKTIGFTLLSKIT